MLSPDFRLCLKAFVGLGPACTVGLTLSDEGERKKIQTIKDGKQENLLVFTDKDPVAGEVTLKLDPGKRIEVKPAVRRRTRDAMPGTHIVCRVLSMWGSRSSSSG